MHLQENSLLTFDLGIKVTLNIAFYIIRSMHLQRLKLLRPKVKEQMHLQKNTSFDLNHGLGSRSYEMVPSTFYIMDICNFKV